MSFQQSSSSDRGARAPYRGRLQVLGRAITIGAFLWAGSGGVSTVHGQHVLGALGGIQRLQILSARSRQQAFDTSQSFRCVDLGLREAEDGVVVSRMREWAAEPKQCDWDPYAGVIAMEVDFDNGQVCVAAFCMAVDRLSAIGKTRLKELVGSAFRGWA